MINNQPIIKLLCSNCKKRYYRFIKQIKNNDLYWNNKEDLIFLKVEWDYTKQRITDLDLLLYFECNGGNAGLFQKSQLENNPYMKKISWTEGLVVLPISILRTFLTKNSRKKFSCQGKPASTTSNLNKIVSINFPEQVPHEHIFTRPGDKLAKVRLLATNSFNNRSEKYYLILIFILILTICYDYSLLIV
ncbi:hypothetical protein P344_03830 [Spiroplasma mirum ATCC 29335]|uniref:Uncharacterized protein n=1 Tax=Spiroplasma mirum ATCC 29335 TaxID=838561 RepID=W0GLE0_9MOLU|nr:MULTISPECIES: hypothetical protein [Spiroplasma]AHF61070.1 hypothetical protein SMM_0648 [Spiroplasma mirum ATCC 29335]AHI58104.1 hypothetical protein P344_03830 [Spiroplasma mirum ATCC 29335]AKM53167.1 hypothetical protein SATRI_v1c07090 [Spiroplasma atrichopogonis]